MTCPYAVNRTVVTQTTFEYDKDGNQEAQQTIESNAAQFVACAKENCGAWKNGGCAYRGTE